MSAPRTITKEQLRIDPYAVWNEYIHLLAMSDYPDLSPIQQAAHLVFWYESEVQNGGHLQYFENQGVARVSEVVAALRQLGAKCQADILSMASTQFGAKRRRKIKTAEKYVETALDGEFDRFDREFSELKPTLIEVLQAFLDQNQSEFVVMESDSKH
jgi:hypothetical protein